MPTVEFEQSLEPTLEQTVLMPTVEFEQSLQPTIEQSLF
jgi:hypothetical protein